MKNVEEAPGIFRVEMSPEEQRRKFTVPAYVARVVSGEDVSRSLPGVVRSFYEKPHDESGKRRTSSSQESRS